MRLETFYLDSADTMRSSRGQWSASMTDLEETVTRWCLALLLVALLAGCGPQHVTVPDTRPPLVPPPADARQPCLPDDHAHQGVLPDLETGTRAEVLRAAAETARTLSLCHTRHQTLREWLDDELEKQRTRPD